MTQEDKKHVIERISFHDSISDLKDVDFAVEAASEDFNLKAKIFTEMAAHAPAHAILASNTSSISLTKIAGVIPKRAH